MAETYTAGYVTAYGAAVRGGYTGTYEEFCAEQAQFAENAAAVAQAKEDVETMQGQVEQAAATFTGTTVPAAVATVQAEGAAQVHAVQGEGTMQAAAVETVGTQQTAAVEAAGSDAVDAVEAAETAATDAVGDAQTAAVQAVQTESTTQQAAVQAKGAETIASIPSDYTALSGEVDDVKAALETFSGEQQLTGWRSDYPYLTNTTEPVDFEPVNRNTSYVGLAVECLPGDVFTITVTASNTAYRAYAWLDADKYVIYKTPNNQTFDRAVITAPEGAAYLAINSLKSYNPSATKGQNRLDALENTIVGFPIFSLYSTLGVIGDSWASGGVNASSDDFPHSWPQIVGRCYGVDATNFSHVGLTAKSWLTSSYGLSKLQNDDAKGLYICALGINDSAHPTANPVGAVEDIETGADTFYGNYGKIIKAIQTKAPTAKVCISTIPQYNPTANIAGYNTAIENIASHFSIQLLVVADDKFFKSSYFVDNLSGNHPPLSAYAGIAEAYNRMISAACISNAAYWNA